jgi:serine/threonine protein kinase/lipopolysaccharide biosynthesis regulator YciM
MPESPDRIESLFAAAVALATPAARAAFLDEACANDPALRARLDALLRAHDRANPLLDQPGVIDPERTGIHVPAGEQPGTVIAGRYKLLEAIGAGGMGTVWVAEQIEPVRRKVALKLIKPGMDSSSVLARFEQERQALALMDHPNIARVLDGGLTDHGRPFFVMEYVKGMPLTKYCDDAKLSVTERLQLFVQVCQAVQHAHQKGVIHRDLKPSNILVAPYDGRPVPKVIDFGLAKAMQQPLTEHTLHTAHGAVLGTPLYMSPEQAQLNNLDVDTRSDLYSLGVLLYELLTGTTPLERRRFQEAAWDEIRRLIREEEPPLPSARLSSSATLPSLAACRQVEPAGLTRLVRGELDAIVMKALEKDRNRRYETANGFAADVQRFLAGEPVQAVPPSAAYRLRKFTRKHRAALTTAAVIVLLLVAGVAVSTWQAVRATAAEADALKAQREEAAQAEKERQANAAANAAAAAAQLANEQAQKRLEQLRKTNDVLLSVFADLDNRQVKDGTEPLEAVLAKRLLKAAAELEGEALGDPLMVAGLQARLGLTLVHLGYPREALPLLVKARDTTRAGLGDDHPQALDCANSLASAYRAVGQMDRAAAILEDLVERNAARHGADDRATLNFMVNLATVYQDAGKSALAAPLLEKAVKLCRARLGDDDPQTVTAVNNLATLHCDLGRADLALPLLRDALERTRTGLGDDHPKTLQSASNLAVAHRVAGQLDLAESLFQDTLKRGKAVLGVDHPDMVTLMNNLALVYLDAGKMDLALPLYVDALKLSRDRLGAAHPRTLGSLNNLADAYQAAGKRDLALPLLEEAAPLSRAKLGADHPTTLVILNSLAQCYRSAGKLDLALPLAEEVLKRRQAALGADHPSTLTGTSSLATMYLAAGKLDLALPLLEETLRLRKARHGADHPATFTSMNNLAMAYQDAGKLDLALPLLEQTLKLRTARLGADHPDTLVSMNNLGMAYASTGKLDLAVPMLKECLERTATVLGANHPDTLARMNNLAMAYNANYDWAQALPLLEKSLQLSKAALGADHPQTLTTANNLATCYVNSGRAKLAVPLMEETLKAAQDRLGATHVTTLHSMHNLGVAYRDTGKVSQALPLLEQCCKLFQANPGANHPDTLSGWHNLAEAYRLAGRLDRALPILDDVLRRRRVQLGDNHPDTLVSMSKLAAAYRLVNRADRAVPLFEETLKRARDRLGPEHPGTLNTMNELGVSYFNSGRQAQAVRLWEECLQIRRARKEGADHPDVLLLMHHLGHAYRDVGELDRAEPIFRELAEGLERLRFQHVLASEVVNNLAFYLELRDRADQSESLRRKWMAVVKERAGAESPAYAVELAVLAKSLIRQGKWADAEVALRATLALRAKPQAAGWPTYNQRATLGRVLLAQKQYAEAETHLLEGYEGLKRHAAQIHAMYRRLLLETAERLVQLYEATGRKEDAARWGKVLAEHRRAEGEGLDTVHDVGTALQLTGKMDASMTAQNYRVRLKAGVTYIFDMSSANPKALDPFLQLLGPTGQVLTQDDDSGGNLNARIVYRVSADGIYRLRATAYAAGNGAFTLTIRPKE